MFAVKDVEAKRRLIQHQQFGVNRHDQREMQLRHHSFRQLPHFARAFDRRLGQKTFRLRAIESRMHAGDVVEQLRNPDPARQHRDIGDERNIAHEVFARVPRIATKDRQFPLICGEAENCVERGRLAGAVGTDQS